MLRSSGKRRRNLPVTAEIHITNLIDVAFVLLIIFMITAPILQGGIEVALPEAEATPLTTSEALVVSIAANGDIFIEKVQVATLDEFENLFRTYTSGPERLQVTLKGDEGVPYGRVAEVLGRMKRMDVADVGLAVEPVM
ncbi:MAG: ExbD/TolR family protein [Longimicrobiales bacterium]